MFSPELFRLAERLGASLKAGNVTDAIDQYVAGTGATLPDSTRFIECMVSGQVIEAMKAHRQATGAGIAEAKTLVLCTASASGNPVEFDW